MSRVSTAHIKKLQKQSHRVGSLELEFVANAPGWKRLPLISGGEGWATVVRFREAGTDEWSPLHALKVFNHACQQRRRRSAFLCGLDLPSVPFPVKLFEGAPKSIFRHTFHMDGQEPLLFEGYLAPFIQGNTFGELMEAMEWEPPLSARIALARQLCHAVEMLEGAGLIHGDLSPHNLMVVDHSGPRPELRLIDFDGYYHKHVPKVPPDQGRVWGSDGYRARKFVFGREDSLPTSDRFSMAILTVELIVRQHTDTRPSLLAQKQIDDGSAELDAESAAQWPAGAELLRHALVRPDPATAPSPREWRAALEALARQPGPAAVPPSLRPPESLRPALSVEVRCHGKDRSWRRLPLPSGNFEPAALELAWLQYRVEGSKIVLSGAPPQQADGRDRPEPLFFRDGGEDAPLTRYVPTAERPIQVESTLHWGDFTLSINSSRSP